MTSESSLLLLHGLTPVSGKGQSRLVHVAAHLQRQGGSRPWREPDREGTPVDRHLPASGADREELVLAVAAGLDDDRARVELVDVYQRHDRGIARQLLDACGDVLR